jgi:cysteine desulfurase / selenocysteine lyase
MSINITSTSDRIATDSPTSSSTQEAAQKGGAQKHQDASYLMSAVPDPAVIAKLANEFFAALPGAGPPTNAGLPAPAPGDAGVIRAVALPPVAGSLPGAPPKSVPNSIPDYPREMFSFPSNAGMPQPPSVSPASPLNEADFRAIAASLAGALPLAPQVTAASAPAAVPASSSAFNAENGGPWAAGSQTPPAAEMYSFPGVPALPSSPPTSSPGGFDVASVATPHAVGRTDPWAEEPHFAGLNDVFSFPRVPGTSVPSAPTATTSQPSVPASQAVPGTIPTEPRSEAVPRAPETAAAVPGSAPSSSSLSPSFAIPEVTGDAPNVEKAVYPGEVSKFPSASELFSFPGVPGVQSPPSTPVLPSSIPAESSASKDLGALPHLPQVPGAPILTTPGLPGDRASGDRASQSIPDGERAAPQAVSLPAGESVEFRPAVAPAEIGRSNRPLDVRLIRQDFPILHERVHGRQLIWLDNAATTQKPNAVIDRLSYFYRHENSNIHRAAHTLAARATDAYESAREKTRRFLNASSTREIIFVRGTTEGINLVANSWGHRYVEKDDEVVITWLEHHANIVPWQQLCAEKGARLRVAPVNDLGEVILEEYEKLLSPRTRIVSFSHVSNALGTITPAREMVEMAHRYGARVLVDGAQAVSHMRTDVQALDCDFYVFSGHKVFGPTGIGVVYGKLDVLETTPPWQGGGNMIVDVTFEKTTYQTPPGRFEAGTGNIADAVGLGAALDYVEEIGMESISAYEHALLNYGTAGLLTVPGLRLVGTAREKAGVLSFVLDDVRTEDVGAALNEEGIAVRSGHHCAQPILRRMGVESSVRPSLALYNTYDEIDALVAALLRLQAGRGRRGL